MMSDLPILFAVSGWIMLVLALYCAPTLIAIKRDHRMMMSIMVINLFLGWTLIGWVVSLSMAVSPNDAGEGRR